MTNAESRSNDPFAAYLRMGSAEVAAEHYALAERFGWRCQVCGNPIPRNRFIGLGERGEYGFRTPHPLALVFDHIVPFADGGSHEASNRQPLHQWCNSRKGTYWGLTDGAGSRLQWGYDDDEWFIAWPDRLCPAWRWVKGAIKVPYWMFHPSYCAHLQRMEASA